MSENQERKRCSSRIDLRAKVRYQIRGDALGSANTISNNISTGGIAFNTDGFLPPLTPLMLEIDLLSRVLRPIGRVVWCQALPHSNRNRLGVEFVELDLFDKNCLEDFINKQTTKP